MASQSSAGQAADVNWALPFVANPLTPVLTLLARATVSGRPWVDELDPASVEARAGPTVEAIREPG